VIDLLGPRLSYTPFLAVMTAVIAVPVALLLGVTAVLWRNSWYDKGASVAALTTISFPDPCVAYILILLRATLWPMFPSLADIRSDMGR